MWKVRRRWLPHRDGIGVRARFRRRRRPPAPTRSPSGIDLPPPPGKPAYGKVNAPPRPASHNDRWYDALDAGDGCFAVGEVFDEFAIVAAIAAFVALAFFVPPVVLIGIDLLWVAVVFLGGAIGRFLLGRPWSVEAVATHGERREWKIKGFRDAAMLREALQAEFDAGLDPRPSDSPLTASR